MADCTYCGTPVEFGATRCNTETCYLLAIAERDRRIQEQKDALLGAFRRQLEAKGAALAERDRRIQELEALRVSTADWLRGIAEGRYWNHREAAQHALNLLGLPQCPQDGDKEER